MEKISCQEYNVLIGEEWNFLEDFLKAKKYSKHFVLVDGETERYCLPILRTNLKSIHFLIIKIKSGELEKNIDTCQKIWSDLIENGADRKSILINLGGGVIGDMGGYSASCYMRGIDFIQIPTTLLSQVDASVGSKTGIDFHGYKNIIGLFAFPQMVFISPRFLKTLPYRELRSGYAEVIKHALIRDAQLWMLLQQFDSLENIEWEEIIGQNVRIKRDVVNEDPIESGLRKILNFGHSLGHAIESVYLTLDKPLLHGEAIAIGMIMETYLGYKRKRISQKELKSIENHIKKIYTDLPQPIQFKTEIINNLAFDKKNEGGLLLFSLLDGIGSCTYNIGISKEEALEAIDYYNGI